MGGMVGCVCKPHLLKRFGFTFGLGLLAEAMPFKLALENKYLFWVLENWNIIRDGWGFGEELGEIVEESLKVFYPSGSTAPSRQPRGGLGFYARPVNLV